MNPLILMKDIVKRYEIGGDEILALNNVNLCVNEGDFISVIGPSGSGKSTLMNIMGCLDVPDSGEYILDSRPVSNLTDAELARVRNQKIGFIFQNFNLLPKISAAENVALPLIYGGMPAVQREARVTEALGLVGLSHRKHHKPAELSGGQQQRVAIARALAGNPSILLCDEPTGNLDSKTGADVMGLIRDLSAMGRTIVLITHNDDIAKTARRRVKIMDGVLTEAS